MIFTSNFSVWHRSHVSVFPVCIARFPPKNVDFKTYTPLIPPISLLKRFKEGLCDERMFEKDFMQIVLKPLDPHKVYEELHELLEEPFKDVVLLCYESSNKFCHRHIVREWFNDNGIVVGEMCIGELKKRPTLKNSLGLLRK